ncbi:serine O-acetyltransferase [Siculibacillus lacustris]|uniref:serine O-acetyltransferase n=1 Tax=Siculibacillus lacustris TaxID=1549641 RepID=A0A4Q9VTT0_9HYPH|nr:serine O-acetyltransferase [Siculibacillus lacustris]TBW39029.1 serine O-acetyltransferase [Siculibacillus lacustris]
MTDVAAASPGIPAAVPAKGRPTLWAELREDVACVKARDPAARFTLEIVLTYPGVHAIVWHRLAHRLWMRGHRFAGRFTAWLGRFLTNVDIHPGATVGRRFFIDHGAGVVVGETAVIGDDVTLYHGVTLGGVSWRPGKRHPTLEDGVLVGAGAKILGPITVGRGARIGANSVVIEDVPPEMTVVGIPGRIVKAPADRRRIGGRIDLEHHLMPDPVGEALASLIDRIDFLEARFDHATRKAAGGGIHVEILAVHEPPRRFDTPPAAETPAVGEAPPVPH